MRYRSEIIINLPVEQVAELINDPENLFHWMEDLLRYETLSVTTGEVGSQTKLVFKRGKNEMIMIETILLKALPNRIDYTYDTDGVHNIVDNHFIAVTPLSTKWIAENQFRFDSCYMKILGVLMP